MFKTVNNCVLRVFENLNVHLRNAHRMSKLFVPSSNITFGKSELNLENELNFKSELLLNEGFAGKLSSGLFTLYPLGYRSLQKLIAVVDEEMKLIGAQRLLMPSLIRSKLMKKSGRLDQYERDLFTLKDRHDIDFCLAPTHEEVITSLMASTNVSRKQLPMYLYQISTKFRDEMKPRYGLLRAKEFLMKDLYTFDCDEETATTTYHKVCDSYSRLFQRLELNTIKVEASTGVIGGKYSHEYHIISDVGEDDILLCEKCNHGFNKEVTNEVENCSNCSGQLKSQKAIEVGHAFLLGTRYSEPFNATFDDLHEKRHFQMGCFGLGMSRILAASVEALSSSCEMRFPHLIAPYTVSVITPKKGSKEEIGKGTEFADHLACELSKLFDGDVVIDDRTSLTIGRRIKDNKLWGIANIVVVGKKVLKDVPKLELLSSRTNETLELTHAEVMDYFRFKRKQL